MSDVVSPRQWTNWTENMSRLSESNVADAWTGVRRHIDALAEHDGTIQRFGDTFMEALVDPRLLPYLMVSGSMAEGATTARWFQRTKDAKEIEIDLMYSGINVPASAEREEDMMEPAVNAPGYVHVFREPVYEKYAHPHLKHKLSHSRQYITGKYIDPSIIKMKTTRFLGLKDDDEVLKGAMAIMFGTRPEDITIEHQTTETATTAEVSIIVKKRDDILIKFSIDNVPCIKLHSWPSICDEWRQRERAWPTQELVEDIIQHGYHLVPKTSPGGDIHKEWRYSFSYAEILLSKQRTAQQKKAYALFKILFYRYIKGIKSRDPAGRGLYSYLCKTAMMWACETHPPSDPVWDDLPKSVDMLLGKLQKHLDAKDLRNYFLVGVNLVDGLASDAVEEAISVIKNIRASLLFHIPVNFDQMIQQGDDICAKVQLVYNIAFFISQFRTLGNMLGGLGGLFRR